MQQIIRHLFKADTLEEVTRERLEELVGEYPSFSIARYLLSSKLRSENADNFTEETQRTNLYFTNPFWLHWLLQDKSEERQWAPRTVTEESVVPEGGLVIGEGLVTEKGLFTGEDLAEKHAPPAVEETLPDSHAELTRHGETLPDSPVIAMGEVVRHGETPPWEESDFAAEPTREPHRENQHPEHLNGTIVEPVEEPEESFIPPLPTEPPMETVAEALVEAPAEALVQAEEMPAAEIQPDAPAAEPQPAEPQHAEPEAAIGPAEPELVFQSYHTIDYFASQGIKFTAEENPSDRLGKQMKSFTEWLKVMRRIPQKEADVLPDVIAEHKIQAIAAHSIESREVVTETMAEVLVKQEMWAAATEIYRKLSLLNPDKSSYFAARIEQIEARSNN